MPKFNDTYSDEYWDEYDHDEEDDDGYISRADYRAYREFTDTNSRIYESMQLEPYQQTNHPAMYDDSDANAADLYHSPPLIIAGSGQPILKPVKRRNRPVILHTIIILITAVAVFSAMISIGPLSSISGNNLANPFFGLSNSLSLSGAQKFIAYRIRQGDTFDSIAAHFGVQLGGIFEMNHLRADAEAIVGELIMVPTSPTYGENYIPPLPPGIDVAAEAYPPVNIPIIGNGCLFCAVAGQTNPGGLCAPTAAAANGVPLNYDLINPNPNSHWVRGFTPYHSGVDLTSGVYGTPLYAAQSGVVIFAGFDSGGGGWSIKLNHCYGLATSYSHMVGIILKVGQFVKQGQLVGYQGNSGESFGSHIHFMVWWHNIPIDATCAYTNLDGQGINITYHYNGCPPDLHHFAWP